MDQGHQMLFMVLQASNFIRSIKPTQLLTLWKLSSHHELCGDNHERWVEADVQTLLNTVDTTHPQRIRPCDVQKIIKSLKLKKACGIDGIPNECLRHFPRRPLVQLTHLFNHCFRLSSFPYSWKEAKIITFPKPSKDPKFSQNLRPISLLSTTGKLFEKVILKALQKHIVTC
jgi:hypothetical protein